MKLTIASGKGGTGKTTVSTNLSSYLSQKNQVILVDLDVEEPNSGLFIEGKLIYQEEKHKMIPKWIENSCSLCGKCQKICNFNTVMQLADKVMVFSQLCHSCYACSELCPTNSLPMQKVKIGDLKHFRLGNLDFIESKLLIGQEQAVPLIAQTLDYTNENFSGDKIKIFDAPPGTSCPVIEATKSADLILLVTENTPFGFHDLKLSVETMESMNKQIAVVINRYGLGEAGVEEYCVEKNIPIIAKIPNMRQAAELYSRGSLLLEVAEIKSEIKKIAKFILNYDNKK